MIAMDILRMDKPIMVNGEWVVAGPRVFTNDEGVEYLEMYTGSEDPEDPAYRRVIMHGGILIEVEGT